jgi:predicted SAM-dependent methyltransferase/ADP-heptose:LPS heptosyltransferase
MTWNVNDPQGNESAKIRWEIVQYTRGRGLDIGCGPMKQFPHWIGIDNRKDTGLFNIPITPDVTVKTAEALDLFASGSMDFCFSSHLLEHIDYENVPAALKEWMRVIRHRGYLLLYLPDEDEYPKVGEKDANPDHRWNVSYDRVLEAMRASGTSWDLIEFQKRNGGKEYSLYFVFQKIGNGQHTSWKKKARPPKTCGVVRYGAIGDLIQVSSVLAGLKKQGYHITLYTSPPGDAVVQHDPNVDEFYLQDRDQVPNHMLGEYWAYQRQKYDKWVQLSESVEGSMLALPGRALHEWPPALRHQFLNRNYLEVAHEIAGIPYEMNMRFYPTEEERRWARKERSRMGQFVIAWPLNGSSVHKYWGGLDQVIAALMLDFPQVEIVTMGNEAGQILEQGWENEKRVHRRSGKWEVRESLAFMEMVDMAIGPETGLMNAVSLLPYPKVVFLSHSTDENLTRDWVNTHVLASENTVCPGRGNNEAPACHQLHYGWQHCKATEGKIAQCQADITVEQAYKVIWHAVTWALERKAA